MKLLLHIDSLEVARLEDEDGAFPFPTYVINDVSMEETVTLLAAVAPRVALEILKDIFLGNGKPCAPAEALQCLEALLPRVEAHPGNWWNHEHNPDAGTARPGPDGGAVMNWPRADQSGHNSPEK